MYVNPEHTAVVSDGADFPAEYLPLAKAQGKALADLRGRNDIAWTFISYADYTLAMDDEIVNGTKKQLQTRKYHSQPAAVLI